MKNINNYFSFLGLTFEFYFPMLFLFSLNNMIDVKFSIQFPNEDFEEDYFVDTEFVIFNFELAGVYIDRYKIHLGFLGSGLNIWYHQKR